MPQPVECPSCRSAVALRDVRPGRFRVACPHCAAALVVAVPDAPDAPVAVAVEVAPGARPAVAAAPADAGREAGVIHAGRLGRYRVVGAGRGRAWGLGPPVELAAPRDRWAADPRFLARWGLEALAASALRHPNLAVPFGIDAAGGRVFAEAAAGAGLPLADPAGRNRLDRQGRVAAVLHAARGLRAAHEQGVYHRDLGLDAIRVDAAGLVVLGGIGVGLTPTAEAAPVAPIPLAEPGGTAPPPPIAPPTPDGPADVAGLGRILATLLGGAAGDRAVPPGLAALARRLTGEAGAGPIDERERFRDLGAAIRALEAELGVAGPLVPADAEAAAFEGAVADFAAAPLAPLRRWAGVGAGVVLGLPVLLSLAAGRPGAAAGWLAFGGLIAAALAGFRAWDGRDRLGPRLAPAATLVGRRDLATLGAAALIGLAALVATHLLATAAIVAAVAVGLAAAAHFGLDRPLAHSRADAAGRLRGLVAGWRRAGYDEEAIRRHVAAAGGRGWEEIYAALFGLDAVAPARDRWGADRAGARRPRFAPARGWLIGRFDAWAARRGAERTRALLEPILERDLEARGVQVLTARRRSKRAAQAVVGLLGQFRRAPDGSVGLPLAAALRRAVDSPEEFLASPEIAEAATAPSGGWALLAATFEAALGARIRFVLGVAALAGSVVWMERNELFSYDQARFAAETGVLGGDRARAIEQARGIGRRFVDGVARVVDAPDEGEVMQLGVVPPGLARHLNGFALLASALILLASALVRGPGIIPFALLGAAIPLAPKLVFPAARPLDPASLAAMALGAAVYAAGRWWTRGRGD